MILQHNTKIKKRLSQKGSLFFIEGIEILLIAD